MSAFDQRPAAAVPAGRIIRLAGMAAFAARRGAVLGATTAVNVLRSPEQAEEALVAYKEASLAQLGDTLGRMRGPAMKAGQFLALANYADLTREQRTRVQEKLGQLHDSIAAIPFNKLEKQVERSLGGPISDFFSEFDRKAVATGSYGQVHRAVTLDGHEVAVKVQYPNMARAIESDLRNFVFARKLVQRKSPGVNLESAIAGVRRNSADEIDYRIEAQKQVRVEALYRDHPFVLVPKVFEDLSSKKLLVTEFVNGTRFRDVIKADQETRSRFAEAIFRFYFALAFREEFVLGDPHPGNVLLADDGRIAFVDFGLSEDIAPEAVASERELVRALQQANSENFYNELLKAGYLPGKQEDDNPDLLLLLGGIFAGYYANLGRRRIGSMRGVDMSMMPDQIRDSMALQTNRLGVADERLLFRRMTATMGLTLGLLRGETDWGGAASEYIFGTPPATEMGEQEAVYRHNLGHEAASPAQPLSSIEAS